jgi:integrase
MSRVTLPAVPFGAKGSIETHEWADGRTTIFRARVRAYGRQHRVHFGTNHQGWSMERAQVELDEILKQVERGTWEPPRRDAASYEAPKDETLHVTASRWWQRKESELAPKGRTDYEWRLNHLLRYLAHDITAEINVRRVDWLRQKLRERGLAPRSVNMVLDALAQILDDAVEYGLLELNPARGKRRRLKVKQPRRDFLQPDMVIDLLDAAGASERELLADERIADRVIIGRRALLATLCLAGPRIHEVTEVPIAQLDIHAGHLVLGKKTAAGQGRTLELSAFLLDELRPHLAAIPPRLRDTGGADLPLFPTGAGRLHSDSNVRQRLLAKAVEDANEKRARRGAMRLPDKVTPHTLRRTFASLCFFAGRDLRWVMGQLGHDDPSMTLRVYAQCMKRSRIDHDLVWRLMRFPTEPERRGGERIETKSETTSLDTGLAANAGH